jgi:MFS superfamily sulfate permease-like transporter
MQNRSLLSNFKEDFPASIVVFFVALPLCLGIALASGAPLFSGVLAGIIGGIIVGYASNSPLGVSGPAAGLAVIVFSAIQTLDSFNAFLLAVFFTGIFQIIFGLMNAGFIAFFFPSSVIKGMLTGIGLLIILKQIPHALGYDSDYLGDESFEQMDGQNTFTSLMEAWNYLTPAAVLIAVISLLILFSWDSLLSKKSKIFQVIQGPVVVVALGIIFRYTYLIGWHSLELTDSQLVKLPVTGNLNEFLSFFEFPDFSQLNNIKVYKIALVMAVVASIETLLCVEATDKLDPLKRVTPTSVELKAQGLGNLISGLIGGLPITQVIVRSSANITFGAKSKLSAILHGFWLLISTVTIAGLLNLIPLSSLATILIVVGYKLAKPSLFVKMYNLGWEQFSPFIATVVAIILTDLLTGIGIGLAVALFFTLHHSYRNSYSMKDVVRNESGHTIHHITLAEEVSFFNKASIISALEAIPEKSKVIIDCSRSKAIDYDISEFIRDYQLHAKLKDIEVETINFNPHKDL